MILNVSAPSTTKPAAEEVLAASAAASPRLRSSCAECHRDFTAGGYGQRDPLRWDMCFDCASRYRAFNHTCFAVPPCEAER